MITTDLQNNKLTNYIKTREDAIAFICCLFNQSLDKDKNENVIVPEGWITNNRLPHPSYTKFPESWLLNIMDAIQYPCTVVVEQFHVDRIYRDSYYMYFSNQHFELTRFCKRLSFFREEVTEEMFYNADKHNILKTNFVGSCVIKPHHDGAIGRTLFNPSLFVKSENESSFQRLTDFTISVMGVHLTVNSFPYSMQDTQTTSCADITLLNIMEYFATRYPDYKFIYPSDIVQMVREHSFERVLPAKGLRYTELTRVLTNCGFSPRLYYDTAMSYSSGLTIKQIWHYYIESGIPVALGLGKRQGHSVIGIGHAKERRAYQNTTIKHRNGISFIDTADFYDKYVVMDDNQLPFSLREFDNISIHNLTPNTIAIPLAKRMFMEAADAYEVSLSILETLGIRNITEQFNEYKTLGHPKNPFVIRLFLTSARSYKKHKSCQRNVDGNHTVKKIYMNLPLPRFVWVCEIYSTESFDDGLTLGEVVLDATSSGKNNLDCLVALRYMDRMGFRTPDKGVDVIIDLLKNKKFHSWSPMQGFTGNLTDVHQ